MKLDILENLNDFHRLHLRHRGNHRISRFVDSHRGDPRVRCPARRIINRTRSVESPGAYINGVGMKSERISVICHEDERALLVAAARAEDRSLTSYIVRAAVAAARETIAQQERTK